MNVGSVLDAVTVFSRGALCTRVAVVQPSEGAPLRRVRLAGLPLLMEPSSLRASVRKGPAGLVVRDVRPELDVVQRAEADLPAEEKALEAAEEKLAALEEQVAIVTAEMDALRRLEPRFQPPSKGAPPRPSSAPAILELSSFVDEALAPLQRRLGTLSEEVKAQVQEVELCRQRIREASSANKSQRTTISRAAVITLSESAAAGPVELVLEYLVMAARWTPAYELELSAAMDAGQLRLRANVVQRTGEDWNDVRLSFSTANLDRRADAPELKSLRIGRRQAPVQRSGWREPPAGLEELFADYDAAMRARPASSPPPPMQTKPAASSVRSFSLGQTDELAGLPPPAPLMAAPASMARASAPKRAAVSGGGVEHRPAAKAMQAKGRGRSMREEQAPMADMEMGISDDMDVTAALSEGAPTSSGRAIEVEQELLNYDGLQLPGALGPPRGQLQRRTGPARHDIALIQSVNVQVSVTVQSVVAVLQREAEEAMSLPLPRWSVVPRNEAAYFDYRYDVDNRASVASDGGWHSLAVFTADVGMQPEYLTVPSVEPRAFRTVKLTNKTPHALLAGPVDVRLGAEFLMTSPFPTLAPGATQRLGLGVEESIKVSRNTRFEEATGGVFGGSAMLTHVLEVEVGNRLAHPIFVDVRERVPAVSTLEKDIKVEELEVRPAWMKPGVLPGDSPVEGERSWRIQLKAGETQKLAAHVVVRIPANKMLNGGNRRA